EDACNSLSIVDGHRENVVGPAPFPPRISPLSLAAGVQEVRHAGGMGLGKAPVPALACASASTCCHRVVAPVARGHRAWRPESACARSGRSHLASEPCDPGLPYGFAECLAPNPDSFLAAPLGGHRPPVAARDESAGSKAA